MKENVWIKKRMWLAFWLVILCIWSSRSVLADGKQAWITSCRLSGKKNVKVSVILPDKGRVNGKKCYLFALPMEQTKLKKKDKPVAVRTKKGRMTFTVKLRSGLGSRLTDKFVVAQKKGNSYRIISNSCYITNPQKKAKYRYHFPHAASKKGLQVSMTMPEDAIELNVQHSVLNINFAELIAAKGEEKQSLSYRYTYQGKTYWFRRSTVGVYDEYLKKLEENHTVVSAILLLGWRKDLRSLIYPSGRTPGHSFYAWNTGSAQARAKIQATLAFLAERYSAKKAQHGRIVNWIVGNEVNNNQVYNYSGNISLQQHAAIYAQAFWLTYQTVSSVYAQARVYISLDHLWNYDKVKGIFPARSVLDSFAQALGRYGDIPWGLAYHPYSSPLTEPKFWENKNKQLTEALDSPVINMGNLSVLTNYIRDTYGPQHRIILSEQGYTSVQQEKNVEQAQAAAIAYSYLLTEADPMVDSFIMNRHVDNMVEVRQGLSLGLWNTNRAAGDEWASTRKIAYDTFKYMDSTLSENVTNPLLSELSAQHWSDLLPLYQPGLYSKYAAALTSLDEVGGYTAREKLPKKWKTYGAVTKAKGKKGTLTIYHDAHRNPNALWGVKQRFGRGISFAQNTHFGAALRIDGSSDRKALVKIRFYNGKNTLECQRVVDTGRTIRLQADLSSWDGRGSVTAIQITVVPSDGGSWKKDAVMRIGGFAKV